MISRCRLPRLNFPPLLLARIYIDHLTQLGTKTTHRALCLKPLCCSSPACSYIARLTELDSQIAAEQRLSAQMIWPSAFVTFK